MRSAVFVALAMSSFNTIWIYILVCRIENFRRSAQRIIIESQANRDIAERLQSAIIEMTEISRSLVALGKDQQDTNHRQLDLAEQLHEPHHPAEGSYARLQREEAVRARFSEWNPAVVMDDDQ